MLLSTIVWPSTQCDNVRVGLHALAVGVLETCSSKLNTTWLRRNLEMQLGAKTFWEPVLNYTLGHLPDLASYGRILRNLKRIEIKKVAKQSAGFNRARNCRLDDVCICLGARLPRPNAGTCTPLTRFAVRSCGKAAQTHEAHEQQYKQRVDQERKRAHTHTHKTHP